ncbi:MAG TPA: DUF4169 family protein [Stellaceae bacterium]|nr:DUF4169 family protein [Stellaceae bacterium]
MASIVNLNRFRKDKKREDAKQRAAENRALHGRSKEQRRNEADASRRMNELLDAKKLD